MSNVIHRTTLEYRHSANEPDFLEPTWKWDPNMSAVAGVPQKYWKAPADWNAIGAGPVEMTAVEKAAVDNALLSSARDRTAANLDQLEGMLRAFALALLDEFNLRVATKINAILNAIDTSTNYASLKTNIAAITDYPTRTIADLRTVVRNKLGT